MKRILCISFLLLAIFLSGKSQFFKEIGIKGGIAITNNKHLLTDPDYLIDTKSITGLSTNIFATVFKSRNLSVKADIGYIQKGSKTDFESLTINHLENDVQIVNTTDEYQNHYNFLSFSPVLQVYIEKNNLIPYAVIAPRFDLFINQNSGSKRQIEIENKTISGINTGLGIGYKVSGLVISAEVIKQFDISYMNKSAGVELKNKALVFALCVSWNFS